MRKSKYLRKGKERFILLETGGKEVSGLEEEGDKEEEEFVLHEEG